jgi:hypothetical protein
MTTDLINPALDYLTRGLSVIALTGKMPNGRVHPHGLHDAFSLDRDLDPEPKIAAFTHPQTTGVGILTGGQFASGGGYYVVDIDGEEGAAQWKELAGDLFMPDRWVAKTGRGLHLWYSEIEPWPTVKLGPKLDFKGVGGYVAAPPSLHPDGHRYEWLLEPDDTGPMEMPAPLLALLRETRALKEAALVTKQQNRPVSLDQRLPGLIYRDASFEGVIDAVREAGEGNRNNLLFWAAATMQDDGATEEDFDLLLDAAGAAGLPRWEARRTIQSAMRTARA